MTDHSTPTRALILGGGGPVGVAWELGLATGLRSGGVDLAIADRVVGTSAGSIAGALLLSGDDVETLVAEVETVFSDATSGTGVADVPTENLGVFMEMMFNADHSGDPEKVMQQHLEVGRFALEATTVPEEAFISTIGSVLGGRPWPTAFACTSVDARSGEFRVWDGAAGVPIERAIASSCSVPGIYPPITIGNARYMDGGVRSSLNADLAAGYDIAVVVSVMPLELPPGFEDPRISAFLGSQRAEIESLRAAGVAVETIVPDLEFLTLSQFGMALMDFSLVGAAAAAGLNLGRSEAERLASVWT